MQLLSARLTIEVTTYKEHYTFSGNYDIFGRKEGDYTVSHRPYEKSSFLINAPEDNRTEIHYKIYEDGVFETSETSDIMY